QRNSVCGVPIRAGGAEQEDYTRKVAHLEHRDRGRYDIADIRGILSLFQAMIACYQPHPAATCYQAEGQRRRTGAVLEREAMAEAHHTCEVVNVGGRTGGDVAEKRATQLAMQVALVERDALGEICLNWGCIPTKALLRNAEVYHLMQHGADFGLYCDNLRFDFGQV